MKDRSRYGLLVGLALAFGCALNGFGKSPPNIVVFLVDDLGATDLGCFGSSFYETPNVDRLAAGGMRFTAAYAACPVCSPTRASIMTGRYPPRTRITDYINTGGSNQPMKWARNTRLLPARYADRLRLRERTIAEALRDGGYATFFAGKWHLGGKRFLPTDHGFELNKGGYNSGSPRSYFSPYHNPYLTDGPIGEHLPLRLADETCEFVEANRQRPFFAYLSFYSVHVPLQAPAELVKKYEDKATGLAHSAEIWGMERNRKVRLVQNHPTYAAMIEAMDTAVGMVLEKLDSLGLSDNTVVLFTSDNGGLATSEGSPTSNLPLRAGKGWLYEGGIRVPTIVHWPGVTAAGSTCASPIISMDFFPTILEITGRSPEQQQKIDGLSIVPLLRGKSLQERPLYWHYPHYGNQGGMPGSAVRDGRWKFIQWHENHPAELYDLETDPGEGRDLANDRTDIAARLRKSLEAWRGDLGAKMPRANPRYKSENNRNSTWSDSGEVSSPAVDTMD